MRRGWLPVLFIVLGVVLVAAWAWQWNDYRAGGEQHRAEHDRLGGTILAAADGAAIRACRGGRYDPEQLVTTLDEVREQVGAEWLALFDSKGATIAAAGARQADGATLFSKAFEPPRRRGGGPGPPGWGGPRGGFESLREFPPGQSELMLQLSRAELDRNLATDLRRFLLTGLAFTAALASFAVLFTLTVRSVELREQVGALEYLGRLGAGLAHETRNPLGVVRGYAERLSRDGAGPGEVRKASRVILDEVDRTVARLDEFLLLSRPSTLARTRFSVRTLVEELVELLRPDLEAKGATFRLDGADFDIDADREQTRRLFLNLLLNATQAIEAKGEIVIELRENEVRIRDDGCGVPPSIRDSLFEPYVSMRAGGTGLGLAIARQIAMAHHWRLRHEPGEPRGATMIIETAT